MIVELILILVVSFAAVLVISGSFLLLNAGRIYQTLKECRELEIEIIKQIKAIQNFYLILDGLLPLISLYISKLEVEDMQGTHSIRNLLQQLESTAKTTRESAIELSPKTLR